MILVYPNCPSDAAMFGQSPKSLKVNPNLAKGTFIKMSNIRLLDYDAVWFFRLKFDVIFGQRKAVVSDI